MVNLIETLFISTCLLQGVMGDVTQSNPRIATRTSWPTETGTMVRILRSDPDMFHAESGDGKWIQGAASPFDFIRFNDYHKRMVHPLMGRYYRESIEQPSKRDLFLRSSKSDPDYLTNAIESYQGESEDLPTKRWGPSVPHWPKRDNAQRQENPFLFRTSKRSRFNNEI